jgi:hypothetical protein
MQSGLYPSLSPSLPRSLDGRKAPPTLSGGNQGLVPPVFLHCSSWSCTKSWSSGIHWFWFGWWSWNSPLNFWLSYPGWRSGSYLAIWSAVNSCFELAWGWILRPYRCHQGGLMAPEPPEWAAVLSERPTAHRSDWGQPGSYWAGQELQISSIDKARCRQVAFLLWSLESWDHSNSAYSYRGLIGRWAYEGSTFTKIWHFLHDPWSLCSLTFSLLVKVLSLWGGVLELYGHQQETSVERKLGRVT